MKKRLGIALAAFVLAAVVQGFFVPRTSSPPPPVAAPEQQQMAPQKKAEENNDLHVEESDGGFYAAPSVKVHADKCRPDFDRLIAASPLAKWTEAVMKAKNQEKFFRVWLDCDAKVISIATAVHESHHMLSDDSYLLANHLRVPRITDIKPRPDRLIRKYFPKDDMYAETYLKDGDKAASAHEYFEFLLDEMNAYAVDTVVSLQLQHQAKYDYSYRDGLGALMMMTMAYVNSIDHASLAQLTRHRATMEALWSQAEANFSAACQVKDFAHDDKLYRTFLSNPENHAGLEKVLGRKLNLPTSCTPAMVETHS